MLVRRDVIEECEGVCARAGMHAGLVDIASFNVVNAVLAAAQEDGADWLLVHVTPEDTTLAIVRSGDLIFFRNRPVGEGSLEDLVHQTAMYRDRLGGRGLSRVIVAGGSDGGDALGGPSRSATRQRGEYRSAPRRRPAGSRVGEFNS